MRITTHFACQTLDWFPLVSTLAQVVHAIAYPLFKNDLSSSYGRYLHEHTLTAKFLIAIPGINVFYKLTALFFTKKSPEKLPKAPSSSDHEKTQALKAVQKDGWQILSSPSQVQNDLEVAEAAVSQDAFVITALPLNVQNNLQVALAAVGQDKTVVSCLPTPIKEHPKIKKAASDT